MEYRLKTTGQVVRSETELPPALFEKAGKAGKAEPKDVKPRAKKVK